MIHPVTDIDKSILCILGVLQLKMGNYTWIFKCVSNMSVTEPTVDIIKFMSQHYGRREWWFEDFLSSLSDIKYDRNLHPKMSCEEFKQSILDDPSFPRKISMNDSLAIFNDRKLYGYIDEDLKRFLDDFGKCLPQDSFMMMLGIYEGFGPVALGWVDGEFVSMMGFEHRCFGGSVINRDLKMSQEEYLEKHGYRGEYTEEGKKEYRQMFQFKREVIEPLETIDWSVEDDDIISWLGRRGFEKDSPSTNSKQIKMMGCAQQ